MKDTKGQFFTPDKIAEIMIIESIKFNKRKSINSGSSILNSKNINL